MIFSPCLLIQTLIFPVPCKREQEKVESSADSVVLDGGRASGRAAWRHRTASLWRKARLWPFWGSQGVRLAASQSGTDALWDVCRPFLQGDTVCGVPPHAVQSNLHPAHRGIIQSGEGCYNHDYILFLILDLWFCTNPSPPQIFWALGTVFEVLLAILVMPTLGWRWLLAFSTVPLIIFALLCFVSTTWTGSRCHPLVMAGGSYWYITVIFYFPSNCTHFSYL